MDSCIGPILVVLGLGWAVLPFVLLAMELGTRSRLERLEGRLKSLEKLRWTRPGALPEEGRETKPDLPGVAAPSPAPVPIPPRPVPAPQGPPPSSPPARTLPTLPALAPPSARPTPVVPAPGTPFRLEDFLGVKLFAWVGAILAFLGVAFFVKYSFDNNLVRPPVRIAIGGLMGLATLGVALRLDRIRYRLLIHALCSASLLIFYATLFSAYRVYDLVPQPLTFGLMALVTAAAFILAVRLHAVTIGVLGLVGGFLTPPLLSTGVDHALGLFSYVALLDVGLMALAARKRWPILLPLAVAGTTFLELGWVGTFLTMEKVPTGLDIFAAFPILFAAGLLRARRAKIESGAALGVLLVPAFVSFAFALYLVTGSLGPAVRSPLLLALFLGAVDGAILLPAGLTAKVRSAVPAAGLAVFALLALWAGRFLEAAHLPGLLVLVLGFALLHGLLPVFLELIRPGPRGPGTWSHAFAPLALVLLLQPIFNLPGPPLILWPTILVLAGGALLTAHLTGQILGFAAMIVLAGVAVGLSILRIPEDSGLPWVTVVLIGSFAVLFWIAALRLVRGQPETRSQGGGALPALSALLPFGLLILAASRLPIADPTPLFGLGALLAVLALAVSRLPGGGALGIVTLVAVAALEAAWHALRFDPARPTAPAAWYIAFFGMFFLWPFVRPKAGRSEKSPWILAALAGPVQFLLLFWTAREAWPAVPRGLLALAFAAVYVLGLARAVRTLPAEAPARAPALALLGALALLFVTAAIPIQFERQWITVGWALEGVALFWLHRRTPHVGLPRASLLLLGAAFVRLLPGINPYLLAYAERGSIPLLNWFLYTYGLVAACLFVAARAVDPARPRILDLHAPSVLAGLGTILVFLLVNLEIADFFSVGQRYLVFQFPTSLAQDMTYSIAWALFALGLLAVGVRIRGAALRYSGLGLLVVTLCKVALYDLWQLGGLYRVGSLVGLAVVLLVVSFLYHRFAEEGIGRARPTPGRA